MKKTGPYVGVTGFMKLSEVISCNNVFHQEIKRCGEPVFGELKFMVGILVSSKTLVGGTNKWANRYPKIETIPELTSVKGSHLLYTIHYNTDDSSTIDEQVDQVMKIAPLSIDAIQLNIKWVNHVKLQRIKRKYPDLRVILQIGSGALAEVDEPGEIFLGDALKGYDGFADDFLVDPSGGKGEPVDVWRAFACIADDEVPHQMQPGIAGGFCSENVHKIRGLMRRLHRPISIDAEGQLRTQEELGGHLVLEKAHNYIINGVRFIGDAIVNYE